LGNGEGLNLQEIETAFSHLKICPKCGSEKGFWLGSKSDHAFAYCENCGVKFELSEIYPVTERSKNVRKIGFFRK
jgi:transcription elongation factor Elf1